MINPESVDLVIYHLGCSDGFGAAWAAWKLLGSKAEYLAFFPGSRAPDVRGRTVAVCDLSFSKQDTLKMISESKGFIMLDHHKTAKENLEGVEHCVIDMTRSGAMLAWNFFHPNAPAPKLIEYIQDQDLWRHNLPFSKEINSDIDITPQDFESFDKLLKDEEIELAKSRGIVMKAYKEALVNKIAKTHTLKSIFGSTAAVVNSQTFRNELGAKLAETADVAFVWYRNHAENKILVSLRSNKVDVSVIAQRWGGGGHRSAAAFVLENCLSVECVFDKNDLL